MLTQTELTKYILNTPKLLNWATNYQQAHHLKPSKQKMAIGIRLIQSGLASI
jgi:hypothetical protein